VLKFALSRSLQGVEMKFRVTCFLLGALALSLPASDGVMAARRSNGNSVEAVNNSLAAKFEEKGLTLGSPVFLRVYKQTSEMELWVQQGPRYIHFKTFGICRWSGGLGPKMYEGDRQSPEGLYHITTADLIVNPRWDRAMNINYPNSFDVVNGRSGSGILIHGKCGSIGCFAIQDQNVEEVYGAVRAALFSGQAEIPVLALPFRFASVAPSVRDTLQLNEFWSDLRRADLLFERDRLPPTAWICDGRYYFADRRGDRHRHAVHLPGCKPLKAPVTAGETAEVKQRAQSIIAASVATQESPKEAVENAAQSCNSKDAKCRLLRVAIKSPVICPKKYARCRTPRAAYSKSVECPLKYPRCRWFVGREPRRDKSVRNGHIQRVKR
jgi:murein L,D-transpeptidase YafK